MTAGPVGNDLDMTDHDRQIEQDEQRLRELGREIEEVRNQIPEVKAEREPHFMDEGEVGKEVVDNTIAPPG